MDKSNLYFTIAAHFKLTPECASMKIRFQYLLLVFQAQQLQLVLIYYLSCFSPFFPMPLSFPLLSCSFQYSIGSSCQIIRASILIASLYSVNNSYMIMYLLRTSRFRILANGVFQNCSMSLVLCFWGVLGLGVLWFGFLTEGGFLPISAGKLVCSPSPVFIIISV